MSDRSKILWRCRRGTRELDVLFENFLHSEYSNLTEQEKQVFNGFLDEPDPDIYDWIMGRTEPGNPAYNPLLEKLRTLECKNK